MRHFYFLIILFPISVFGQTKVDKFVSINIPGSVQKLDTIVKNIKITNLFSQVDDGIFMVQKTKLDAKENDLNALPSDIESLEKSYDGAINGYLKSMDAAKASLLTKSKFKIDTYIFYNLTLSASKDSKEKFVESNFLILDEYIYVFSYINSYNFDEEKKNAFMKSIAIDSSLNPQQMIGKSSEYKLGYVFGQVIFFIAILVLIIYIVRKSRKKSQ